MAADVTAGPSAADERRLALFDQLLALVPPGRCIDLGAGHGKFSIRASQAGWDVVAVDARSDRFPAVRGIEFVESDVRQVDVTGYDLILCLGLFYHLTLDDQVDLLRRCVGTPMLIDTHVATGEHRTAPGALSGVVDVGDSRGVWYREGGNADLLSGWDNDRSFWHTPESLVRLLAESGFPVTLEASPHIQPDRRFFVALPDRWVPPSAGLRGQTRLIARTVRRRIRRVRPPRRADGSA